MNHMSQLSSEGQKILAALQKAASRALERKARLGQYAVVWRDGKPVTTGTTGCCDALSADTACNERMPARLESLQPLDEVLPEFDDEPIRDDAVF